MTPTINNIFVRISGFIKRTGTKPKRCFVTPDTWNRGFTERQLECERLSEPMLVHYDSEFHHFLVADVEVCMLPHEEVAFSWNAGTEEE